MTATAEVIDRDAFTQPKPSNASHAAPTATPPPAAPPPKHSPRVRAAALAAGITDGEMDSLSAEQLYQEIRIANVAHQANLRPEPTPAPVVPAVPAEEAIDWGKDPNTGADYTENDYSPAIRKAVKAAYAADKKDKEVEELKARLQAAEEREQKRARQSNADVIEKVLAEFTGFGRPEDRTPGSVQLAYYEMLGNMMSRMPDAERTTIDADLRKKAAMIPGITKVGAKPAPKPVIESPLATPEERTAMLTATKPRNETGQFISAADLESSSVEAPSDRAIIDVPQTGREYAIAGVTETLRKRGHYVPPPSKNGAEDLGIPE